MNLLENKAYTFEGEHGEKIIEIPIPADMAETVAKHRHDLIEKIAENDDAVMSDYLDGKEISLEDLRKTLAQGGHREHDLPGDVRLGAQEQGRAVHVGRRR